MIYCVDLDGTLIKNDMSVTSFFAMALRRPFLLGKFFRWHREGGRALLKHRLGEIYEFDPADLKFNAELVAYLEELARDPANEIYLVSGSTQKIVDRIAARFPFFRGAFGSSPEINLTGRNKLALIRARFGAGPVCYAGNARVDLKVWKGTDSAIVVSARRRFIKKAGAATKIEKVIRPRFARSPGRRPDEKSAASPRDGGGV